MKVTSNAKINDPIPFRVHKRQWSFTMNMEARAAIDFRYRMSFSCPGSMSTRVVVHMKYGGGRNCSTVTVTPSTSFNILSMLSVGSQSSLNMQFRRLKQILRSSSREIPARNEALSTVHYMTHTTIIVLRTRNLRSMHIFSGYFISSII